jgi:peptidoglycan/xylan/chitin deacetylase (PgdA/CDA1 family)
MQNEALSTPAPTAGLATIIKRGHPALPEVALTFDDGPGPYTAQVLAILQRFEVPGTFFAIGQNIASSPSDLSQALAHGNAIENHTFTHPHLPALSYPEIYQELSETQEAIFRATGTRPTLFRPPYGEYDEKVLTAAAQLGLTAVIWSAAANDWRDPQPSADLIASRTLSSVENGTICLFHDSGGDRANTVAALPAIITGLQERGLRLVTVSQMLERRA